MITSHAVAYLRSCQAKIEAAEETIPPLRFWCAYPSFSKIALVLLESHLLLARSLFRAEEPVGHPGSSIWVKETPSGRREALIKGPRGPTPDLKTPPLSAEEQSASRLRFRQQEVCPYRGQLPSTINEARTIIFELAG